MIKHSWTLWTDPYEKVMQELLSSAYLCQHSVVFVANLGSYLLLKFGVVFFLRFFFPVQWRIPHFRNFCLWWPSHWLKCLAPQFSSVAQSCPTLFDPMNRSTPGLPVHHHLPELTQTQVHRDGDAIQPSHPLLSPTPPAPNRSQHQSLFQWVNSSHEVAKVLVSASASFLSKNTQDWSPLEWTGWISLQSKGLSRVFFLQHHSSKASILRRSAFFSPTFTSIHDHWKNHSLD